jgi:glycine/D-amino acid oxidase-like deaminating enzyme
VPELWDREVDVLVIGAGMGGMCAALFAKLRGLDVLVCEKTDQGSLHESALYGVPPYGGVWIHAKRDGSRTPMPRRVAAGWRAAEA